MVLRGDDMEGRCYGGGKVKRGGGMVWRER